MARVISITIASVLVVLTAVGSKAESVTIDLPGLVSGLTYGDSPLATSFDAGVQFASIESVKVRFTGYAQGGISRYSPDGVQFADGSFTPLLYVALPNGKDIAPAAQAIVVSDEDAPESVWEATMVTLPWAIDGYLDDVLDGKGEVDIESVTGIVIAFGTSAVIEPSHVDITHAEMIISGTLVPEPPTIVLLILGVAAFTVARSL